MSFIVYCFFFFFNDTATTEIYTLSLHDALPILHECNLSHDMPKGLFKKMLGKKFIVLNLTRIENEYEKQFVLAHELGHAILHSSDTTFFLHDHTFCNRGRFELEANKFAAELLINEKYLDACCLETLSIEQLAAYFCVPK